MRAATSIGMSSCSVRRTSAPECKKVDTLAVERVVIGLLFGKSAERIVARRRDPNSDPHRGGSVAAARASEG